jgi:hypothetical protein
MNQEALAGLVVQRRNHDALDELAKLPDILYCVGFSLLSPLLRSGFQTPER